MGFDRFQKSEALKVTLGRISELNCDFLGPGVWFVGTDQLKNVDVLFSEEGEAVRAASTKRQKEFATGRWCTRRALQAMGFPPAPIPRGHGGMPIWPPGATGSISHCKDYCCAVVSKAGCNLGVDVEFVDPSIESGVWRQVYSPDEDPEAMGLDETDIVRARYAIFSAKESLFKCIYPHVLEFISFQDVKAELNFGEGLFELVLRKALGPRFPEGTRIPGRHIQFQNHVMTFIGIKA